MYNSKIYYLFIIYYLLYKHFIILASAINWCVSISAFASLLVIPLGITSPPIGLKICTIAEVIKRYKSIINKKKNRYDKIVLLGKFKVNRIKVLIFKTLIDSNISHDECVLVNNVQKEYADLKKRNHK